MRHVCHRTHERIAEALQLSTALGGPLHSADPHSPLHITALYSPCQPVPALHTTPHHSTALQATLQRTAPLCRLPVRPSWYRVPATAQGCRRHARATALHAHTCEQAGYQAHRISGGSQAGGEEQRLPLRRAAANREGRPVGCILHDCRSRPVVAMAVVARAVGAPAPCWPWRTWVPIRGYKVPRAASIRHVPRQERLGGRQLRFNERARGLGGLQSAACAYKQTNSSYQRPGLPRTSNDSCGCA